MRSTMIHTNRTTKAQAGALLLAVCLLPLAGRADAAATNQHAAVQQPVKTQSLSGKTATPASGVSVALVKTGEWQGGYGANIVITNNGSAAVTRWTLGFSFTQPITSLWNGVLSNSGNNYTVTNASWNGAIPVGGNVTLGFNGTGSFNAASASNCVFNGSPCLLNGGVPVPPSDIQDPPPPPPAPPANVSVAVVETGQWQGGFGANLIVTNNGTAAVSQWTLGFSFAQPITSLWNGVVTSSGNSYSVINESWNGAIPVGGNVTLGFNGTGSIGASSASNCVFNGSPCTLSFSMGSVTPPQPAQAIVIGSIDGSTPVRSFAIPQGVSSFPLSLLNPGTTSFSVVAGNSTAVSAQIVNNTLQLTGFAAGRSALKIQDSVSGTTRYVGVRVKNADGSLPKMPGYVSIGSVSEDSTDYLSFWQSFQPGPKNKRMDVRYIYLNGGPVNGWDTWGNNPGDRATNFIRNSQTLGIIPFFVFYNIADGGESYFTDSAHVADATYMAGYFQNLKLALDIINRESPDDVVGLVLEPDFLGYLAQNAGQASTSSIAAMTHAAYTSGVLTSGVDPQFPDTVQGLVKAINYTISKYSPQTFFGWQLNLWASPAGGWVTHPVAGKGLMHETELLGDITKGRQAIYAEAAAITNFYLDAGIATNGASFVSIDKYGLDATGYEASAAADPADSYWFWNNDLWQNYLTFVKSMHDTTKLPVILWQIPVGHINTAKLANPYDSSNVFPDLINSNRQLEDSAPVFFLGDTFSTAGARYTYFSSNLGKDSKVTADGTSITWGSHMSDAASSGVMPVLFGAGVGASTSGAGTPTDSFWWITNAQRYYQNPVPHQ